jgi:hypothetical protein
LAPEVPNVEITFAQKVHRGSGHGLADCPTGLHALHHPQRGYEAAFIGIALKSRSRNDSGRWLRRLIDRSGLPANEESLGGAIAARTYEAGKRRSLSRR